MKKILSTLSVLLVAVAMVAQTPQVLFYGYIEEGYFETNMPKKVADGEPERLQGVKVKVMVGDEVVHSINCRTTGFYAVLLKEGQLYHVVFEKDGYLPRTFELNTAGLEFPNDEATIKCVADVSLYKKVDNTEVAAFVKAPFARCAYNKGKHEMVWDMEYTRQTKSQFANMAEPLYSVMKKK
jgi:hypothetical protein